MTNGDAHGHALSCKTFGDFSSDKPRPTDYRYQPMPVLFHGNMSWPKQTLCPLSLLRLDRRMRERVLAPPDCTIRQAEYCHRSPLQAQWRQWKQRHAPTTRPRHRCRHAQVPLVPPARSHAARVTPTFFKNFLTCMLSVSSSIGRSPFDGSIRLYSLFDSSRLSGQLWHASKLHHL